MNSSSESPRFGSAKAISSRFTPGAKALSLSFFLTRRPSSHRPLRADERRRDQQAGHRVRRHDGPAHPVPLVFGVGMGQNAVDHVFVDAGLTEPVAAR